MNLQLNQKKTKIVLSNYQKSGEDFLLLYGFTKADENKRGVYC